ncbi:protein-tyrosine phosphatase [Pseudomonas cuatrocienegasensis]|uniref:protein-tyrosine-phosphatase n=1 Tax=Pseudomonas cuatrocienegasensis TaxID=543360 RepID=A0ABY1BAE9_9PSED|nr:MULTISPECIES: low molecular weight protein-tyrosine-phosphatase [Pseudomonas]OEC34969.1 protein-tyrosine-phosphatase [Pseudomonas sp. 21C1]SEQ37499.1 protein-tyrosine phosphatase [Pseudomonas cuatrocienegasensis]
MRVLFVCLGNICRSPTAEGVLRHKLRLAGLDNLVEVDSVGTGDWHVGKGVDPRTAEAALQRGYDLSALRGRQVALADFARFDLILAMDKQNLQHLQRMRPAASTAEVDLFLRRYQSARDEVPDPYYGGPAGFDEVLDLVEHACDALVHELRRRL